MFMYLQKTVYPRAIAGFVPLPELKWMMQLFQIDDKLPLLFHDRSSFVGSFKGSRV